MADDSHRNQAPVSTDGGAPSTHQAVLDANGFDPAEFEWRPVPRRPRADGWTPEVQQAFIGALGRTGLVERACEEVGKSVSSAYALRQAPGGEGFAAAWKAVLVRAADRVLDLAFEQAIVGEEIPVYDQDGVRTGVRWKYNARMATLLLKAYHPNRFDPVARAAHSPEAAAAPSAQSIADIVARLGPVTPASPHLLAAPERRERLIADARDEATRPPAVENNSYRPPRVPPQPARVQIRSRRNKAQRRERDNRIDDRYGLDHDRLLDD